jgi:hypothetical protein
MTHEPTSKRQYGADIPSKKINVCPEIACDKDAVVNRIASTDRLNDLCRNGAKALGISNRLTWLEVAPLPPLYLQNAVRARLLSGGGRSRSGMIVPYGGVAPPFQFAG